MCTLCNDYKTINEVCSTCYQHVPYYEDVDFPSQIGRAIIIDGTVRPTAVRFAINLVCRERDDIAMHFNPRLDRNYIARNSKINGKWGEEENSLNGPSPFQQGMAFTLHILFAERCFKLCCNGRHICSFAHRVPLVLIKTLHIHGDLSLSQVKHEMLSEYPPPREPILLEALLREPSLISVGHTALLFPTSRSWRSEIPKQSFFFLGHFEPNLRIRSEITIGGYVRLLPHGFFVNLQSGLQLWRSPDVHLHINPRFRSHEGHNELVVNARLKEVWGCEKRYHRCRFQPGMHFTLSIYVDEERYLILINGAALASMDHRARPSSVNSLYVSGDVDVTSVGFRQVADPSNLLNKFPRAIRHKYKPISDEVLEMPDSSFWLTRSDPPEIAEEALTTVTPTPLLSWKEKLVSETSVVPFMSNPPPVSGNKTPHSLGETRMSTDQLDESAKHDKDGNAMSGLQSTSAGPFPSTDVTLNPAELGERKDSATLTIVNGLIMPDENIKSEVKGDPVSYHTSRSVSPGVSSTDREQIEKSSVGLLNHQPEFEEKKKSDDDLSSTLPMSRSSEALIKESNVTDTNRREKPTGVVVSNLMSGTCEPHVREGARGGLLLRRLPVSGDKSTPVSDIEGRREPTVEAPVTRGLRRSRENKEELLGIPITVSPNVSEETLVSSITANIPECLERELNVLSLSDQLASVETSGPLLANMGKSKSVTKTVTISPETKSRAERSTSPAEKIPVALRLEQSVSDESSSGSRQEAAPVVKFENNTMLINDSGATSVTTADPSLGTPSKSDDSVFQTAKQSIAGSSTESKKASDEEITREPSGETNSNVKTDERKKKSKG